MAASGVGGGGGGGGGGRRRRRAIRAFFVGVKLLAVVVPFVGKGARVVPRRKIEKRERAKTLLCDLVFEKPFFARASAAPSFFFEGASAGGKGEREGSARRRRRAAHSSLGLGAPTLASSSPAAHTHTPPLLFDHLFAHTYHYQIEPQLPARGHQRGKKTTLAPPSARDRRTKQKARPGRPNPHLHPIQTTTLHPSIKRERHTEPQPSKMPFAGAAAAAAGGVAARFLSPLGRFAARRVPAMGWKVLSSKQAPRGLNKGKGCARTGVQGPDGRFRPVAMMQPNYVLPPGGLAAISAAQGADASASPSPLRPYVAEYPREQLDAAVASLRAKMAAQAARTEALDAERRTRALEAARRIRWAAQQPEGRGERQQGADSGSAGAKETKTQQQQ